MQQLLAPKRWYRLIPIAFITYSLAYLDRANYGFGAAGGMAEDLGITPGMSSLLGSLFFLGYFFFQVPGAIYAERKSAKKLIFWSLILWGGLAMATGMTGNVSALIVIRFYAGRCRKRGHAGHAAFSEPVVYQSRSARGPIPF